MARNPAGDLIQFIAGGSLFVSGLFLLLNQVMASSSFGFGPGRGWRWGGGVFPIGTPGTPSARKVDASPSRSLFQPGGLMEQCDASLQRGR